MAEFTKFFEFQIIRERISTSTVLLLAKTAQNLRQFHVRRNAVILKCDWPKNPDWSEGFYQWLRFISKSYEATEKEVSNILGFRWIMLPDKLFRNLYVNVRQS